MRLLQKSLATLKVPSPTAIGGGGSGGNTLGVQTRLLPICLHPPSAEVNIRSFILQSTVQPLEELELDEELLEVVLVHLSSTESMPCHCGFCVSIHTREIGVILGGTTLIVKSLFKQLVESVLPTPGSVSKTTRLPGLQVVSQILTFLTEPSVNASLITT